MNRDFVGIVLEYFEDSTNNDYAKLRQDVVEGTFVDTSLYGFVNESENVDESVIDPESLKLVKEKYGTGVSLKWGDREYRYISDKFSSEELFKKLQGILKHQGIAQIRKWLQNNAIIYWDSVKGNHSGIVKESEDQVIAGSVNEDSSVSDVTASAIEEATLDKENVFYLTANDIKSRSKSDFEHQDSKGNPIDVYDLVKDIKTGKLYLVVDTNYEKGHLQLSDSSGKEEGDSDKELVVQPTDGNIPSWVKKFYGSVNESANEATQSSDIDTKVDQNVLITPKVGVAYIFDDGEFIVDYIDKEKGIVYLLDAEGEYYSMSIEDFKEEVLDYVEEAELEDEPVISDYIESVFSDYTVVKDDADFDKTGLVYYAIANESTSFSILIHIGEETIDIFSEEDDFEVSESLKNYKKALSKAKEHYDEV